MVYFKSDNIVSPLGFNTAKSFSSILGGQTGIRIIDDMDYYPEPFPASMIDSNKLEIQFKKVASKYNNNNHYTKLEKMIIVSINDALADSGVDICSPRTAIILSTTKGNIDLLGENKQLLFVFTQ